MRFYFFRKRAYENPELRENMYDWDEDMCRAEWNKGENPHAIRYDLENEGTSQFDMDYCDGYLDHDEWIMRVFL
jgi:hypothetical protein